MGCISRTIHSAEPSSLSLLKMVRVSEIYLAAPNLDPCKSLELLGVGDTPLLQYRGLPDFLVI
jgi:hypothetical protein